MTRVWYVDYVVIDKDGIFSTWEKCVFKHMHVSIYDHDCVKLLPRHGAKRF